ncbi:Cyanovirin-N [Microdochium bolleyi]|uniref:Cyanovirin-N n=1 Tax=Microdochium bolleyi TaxID=196109 RepID=A0A136JCM3_9PEZI|nr:Cyanovirin-N [Microdochium bolleyi]
MSFFDSSQDVRLEDNVLYATCCTADGEWQPTQIDLNDVLGNSSGIFEWGGGGWHGSATNYRLEGPVLVAQLDNGDGDWPEAKIDLNERITNNNGNLEFLG